MRTRITELLGIEHPIIQGAMSWVSFPPLVAAVSNAGGLGILGAAFMSPVELEKNIKEIKENTDKPFGVNFMPGHPELEDLLDVIVGEKVAVASYGKGNPKDIIGRTKPAGIINLPTMGSAKHAIRAEQDGADAVIVQGTEGGGHTGHVSTMVLTPRVAGSVDIPVVAAGGIGTAQGLIAALALGAEGVSMGSRFIVTQEAPVPQNVKEHIVGRTEDETIVTDNFTGVRCRVIKNEFSESLVEMSKNGSDPWEIMTVGVGKIRKAYVEGDIVGGSLTFGQVCGMIDDIPTCQELLDSITSEAESIMQAMGEKVLSPVN
ncbi:MAG: enoyl-[acyl-carrier-protein] reductase FabK [Proteobacteria bacterium]|nr:enoyl-[acyl-carrier-protein] reductase FabK [Pseudomonadota bacterium]